MTSAERNQQARIEFEGRNMLDDDETFIRVSREHGRWFVHFYGFNGWEARREIHA